MTSTKLSINQALTLTLDPARFGPEGQGIASVEGIELLVSGGNPGDRVLAQIEHLSPHQPRGWARVLERVEASGDAHDAPCPHAAPTRGRCGGCPLMHLNAEAQGRFKTQQVVDALTAHHITATTQLNAVGASLGYRNRGHFIAARGHDGARLLGSYAPRSHDVVSTRGCLIVDPTIEAVAQALRAHLNAEAVPVYPAPGGLRYVTLRANQRGEALVELVVDVEAAPWIDVCVGSLMALTPVVGVATSTNRSKNNALHVAAANTRAGRAVIAEQIGDFSFEVGASTFSQLNASVAAAMYQRAAERVATPSCVWDLYCGAGGLGLTVAQAHPKTTLYGAESHAGAVARATHAAAAAGIEGHFAVVDLQKTAPSQWPAPDTILVNPPRRGLDEPVLSLLSTTSATQCVYMSCNPRSFARDVAALCGAGWRLDGDVEAFDMLPQTRHVELIARLIRP